MDDSALYRQMIYNVLREVPDVEVVGSAKNGEEAIVKLEDLQPDLMTLDVQMPDMNGIEVLEEVKERGLAAKAVMVSSYTSQGAEVTTDALMRGAFDFILKPTGNDAATNRQRLLEELAEKILLFRESRRSRRKVTRGDDLDESSQQAPESACRAVLVGASTGGPAALRVVVPKLPAGLPAVVLVVQHMPATYTRQLAARLDAISPLTVSEAVHGARAEPGNVLIAPGGKHMKLTTGPDSRLRVELTEDPPEHRVRPSVDYLIRSAAKTLNGDALAVIMTGMGVDGLAGCRMLKESGGYVFAQSEEDSVIYGMPKAISEAGLVDRHLRLGRIAPAIVRHLKRSRR